MRFGLLPPAKKYLAQNKRVAALGFDPQQKTAPNRRASAWPARLEGPPSSFYPRECNPGHLAVESRFDDDTIAALAERGHAIDVFDDYSLGYVTAATCEDGLLKAGASPRYMQCYAAGR